MNFFTKYKWFIEVIAWVVIGAMVILSIHALDQSRQKIGYDRAVAEYTERDNKALKAALAETERLNEVIKEANDAAKKREDANRELTARNAALLTKLRDTDSAIARAVSSATDSALREAVGAFDALFADCRESFEEMGRAAAGHLSDVKTLTDAWPRGVSP